jgi:hypothetical protein
VAAVLLLGGIGLVIIGAFERRTDPVAEGCLTLADYAAASAEPRPPIGQAPGVTFPPVAPAATATTGLQPPGTWIVVADAEGPRYQMRVRDVRPCDRLPSVRSEYAGGSLLLAQVDVQQLRPNGLGPWVGPEDRVILDFGFPPGGMLKPATPLGVPGAMQGTTLSPLRDFAQSSLLVLDVPPTDASVNLYLDEGDGPSADHPIGWRVRDGSDTYPRSFVVDPQPGATPTTGELEADETATIIDPATGVIAVATVSDLDVVEAYPAYRPADGHEILEARLEAWAWAPGEDPATDVGPSATPTWRWTATTPDGTELPILGETSLSGADGVPWPLARSDFGFGILALERPRGAPIRLTLEMDGREVAVWRLRD